MPFLSLTLAAIASWYGTPYHGQRTASGEIYNMNAMTAAHPTLPFGTRVKVCNKSNGKCAVVRINDRGPYAPDRQIDLSRAAAQRIGVYRQGVGEVTINRLY